MATYGESIREYTILEKVGEGGFAEVYRAVCKRTGKEVAIKLISKKRIKDEGLEDRVSHEVGIHSRLDHQRILKMLTCFEDSNFIYLVLEFCRNGNLQQYLKKVGYLPVSEACAIMKQVVEGLLYLHRNKIMHRDLSLANLMLTKDMDIKIADFGLVATQRPNERKHMSILGTPSYMPPEIASRGTHGLEADIWNIGIILYTCLVGKLPFDTKEEGLQSNFTRVVLSNIEFPTWVVREAKDLIEAMLQKNPKDRIKLDRILDHPFFLKFQPSSLGSTSKKYNKSIDSGLAIQSYMSPLSPSSKGQSSNSFRPKIPYSSENNNPNLEKVSQLSSRLSRHSQRERAQHLAAPEPIANPLQMPVPPINTQRLKPFRQKTNTAACSILETGEVCFEFIKGERVREVMRISSDGLRIVVYKPNKGKGVNLCGSPPPVPSLGADKIFNYENVPMEFRKKYEYAYKFVELVKSKTPKITYFTDHAKCCLMENGPVHDFDVNFYDGGRISKSENRVTGVDVSGKSFTLNFFDETFNFSPNVQHMLEHLRECWDYCCDLNKMLSGLNEKRTKNGFPVVVGTRRSQILKSPLTNHNLNNKENISPQSEIKIPTMRGYEASLASAKFGGSSSLSNSKVSKLLREVNVPEIGRVRQFENQEIHVDYLDKSKLVMNSGEVIFTNSQNKETPYNNPQNYPDLIRFKLSQLKRIIQDELLHSERYIL